MLKSQHKYLNNNKTVKKRNNSNDLGGKCIPCCINSPINKRQNNCHIKPNSDKETIDSGYREYKDREYRLSQSLYPDKHKSAIRPKDFGLNIPFGNSLVKVLDKRFKRDGIVGVNTDINELNKIITARKRWMERWYLKPDKKTPGVNCYTCDANGKDHERHIELLTDWLKEFERFADNSKTEVNNRSIDKNVKMGVPFRKPLKLLPRNYNEDTQLHQMRKPLKLLPRNHKDDKPLPQIRKPLQLLPRSRTTLQRLLDKQNIDNDHISVQKPKTRRKSVSNGRKSVSNSRKSVSNSRKSVSNSRKSVSNNRKTVSNSRKSINNSSRKSVSKGILKQ
jgi:hypothetical protein